MDAKEKTVFALETLIASFEFKNYVIAKEIVESFLWSVKDMWIKEYLSGSTDIVHREVYMSELLSLRDVMVLSDRDNNLLERVIYYLPQTVIK